MNATINLYTPGRIKITYTGVCELIKFAVQALAPECYRLRYDTNVFLTELSGFRSINELKQHLIAIQENDPKSSVVLIVKNVELIPIPELKCINLSASKEEWVDVIKSAAVSPYTKIVNAIEICERMLCQNNLKNSQHRILQLIAQGFDIPTVSAMTDHDLKYVYSIISNMRDKLKIKSLHHFMLYIRNEFNYLHIEHSYKHASTVIHAAQ